MSVDPLAILGRAVTDPAVRAYLTAHGLRAPRRGPAEADDDVAVIASEAKGISIELTAVDDFAREHADPPQGVAPGVGAWIVTTVDLLGAGSNSARTRPYARPLPFGIVLGSTGDAVIGAVGRRPRSRSRGTGYAHAWWFVVDRTRILAALDDRLRLSWLRLAPLDRETAAAMARRAPAAPLDAACGPALTRLSARRPTVAWARRARGGDARFTPQVIARADALLAAFIGALAEAARAQAPARVLAAVRRVVVGFDRLALAKPGLIETPEREALAAYLHTAVRKTGYRIPRGEDLTAAWRTEW